MLKRRALLLGALLAPVALRAEIAPARSPNSRPPRRPKPDPDALIETAGLGGEVSFAALDASTGALIATRGTGALPPASTMKAITTLYALDRLGPDHRFHTRIIRAGDLLVLAGGGDPVLSTDDLAVLAERLVDAGATPPRFAIWGGALPRIAAIASDQAVHVAYNPALSGMILNFNRVHLDWRQAGGDYRMSLEARAEAHSPRAYTVTARAADQAELFTYFADATRENWVVSRAAMGRAGSRWLPVRLPELYAGDVFQTLCRGRGLVLPAPEVIDTLPAGPEVAAVESPPLRTILRDMMTYSTNLTAEIVGLHASGAPTLAASGAAMRDWLAEQGIGGGMVLADHSGLSPDSRVTAMTMARVMAGLGQAAGLRGFMKPDPLDEDLGPSGTGPGIVAKTGTLNFVSNLAGYATAADGQQIAFAVFCADMTRRAASEGQELPAGVSTWTRHAKALQRALIEGFAAP